MASRRRGPLRAYRIADARYPIFDGGGAARHGGRWNSPGRGVVYAAETYAGTLLEKLVHANIGRIPKRQRYVELVVPEEVEIEEIEPDDVPGWDAPDEQASRAYGDVWYDERRTAVLVVPSIVARIERNVAISQDHPDFPKILAGDPQPVLWDSRLFRTARRRPGSA